MVNHTIAYSIPVPLLRSNRRVWWFRLLHSRTVRRALRLFCISGAGKKSWRNRRLQALVKTRNSFHKQVTSVWLDNTLRRGLFVPDRQVAHYEGRWGLSCKTPGSIKPRIQKLSASLRSARHTNVYSFVSVDDTQKLL